LGEFPLGTFCSGTDATVFVFQAFARAASEFFNLDIHISHEFGAEFEEKKRAFILDMWPTVKCLFKDVLTLDGATSHDVKSDTEQPVKKVRGAIAGFSCKDASGLNPNASSLENRLAVAEVPL
jgi:hypothetical protein